MATFRSTLFYLGLFPLTVLFSLIGIAILPLDRRTRYLVVTQWSRAGLWWLRISCGLTSRISGLENIPARPSVIFCKHQSAWETMALQLIVALPAAKNSPPKPVLASSKVMLLY